MKTEINTRPSCVEKLNDNKKVIKLRNSGKHGSLGADFTAVAACSALDQVCQSNTSFVGSIFVNFHSLANVDSHGVIVLWQKSVNQKKLVFQRSKTLFEEIHEKR